MLEIQLNEFFLRSNSLAIVLLLGCGKSEPEQMAKGPQPLSSVQSESLSWDVAWEKAGFDILDMFTEFCRGIKAQIAWRRSKDWAYFANR